MHVRIPLILLFWLLGEVLPDAGDHLGPLASPMAIRIILDGVGDSG